MTLFLFSMMIFLLYCIFKNYLHYMNILMIFECLILLIFFYLNFYQELYMLMMFCVFSVCESSLGLTLMTVMIRCNGNDYCNTKFLIC